MSDQTPITHRQHLVFDADDTLWENNIYFEEAFDRFVTFLDHEHLTSTEIQALLDEAELDTRTTHGYGARAFAHSLRKTFIRITGLRDDHPHVDEAERLGLAVLDAPFALMKGVVETLRALRPHHDLLMLTKGPEAEQQAKIDRSGIAELFDETIITPEKTADTFIELLTTRRLSVADAWMIGNSPRSDINPALTAGMNAIFVPHPRTWHLEVEEFHAVPHPGRLFLELPSFAALATTFAGPSPKSPD